MMAHKINLKAGSAYCVYIVLYTLFSGSPVPLILPPLLLISLSSLRLPGLWPCLVSSLQHVVARTTANLPASQQIVSNFTIFSSLGKMMSELVLDFNQDKNLIK